MRRIVLSVVLAAGLAATLPAVASEPAATAAPADASAKPAKDDPNRIICKREHVVGSNRPQKVCLTAAQRSRLKDSADRVLEDRRVPEPSADAPGV